MIRLGFDPGETTGWCVWIGPRPLAQGEIPGGLMGFLEWVEVHGLRDADEVVVENFVVQPDFVGTPVASEIIGAIYAIWGRWTPIVRQLRSDKATLFHQRHRGNKGETERFNWLRDRGFTGSSHELDANTHILKRLKTIQDRDALCKYWNVGN